MRSTCYSRISRFECCKALSVYFLSLWIQLILITSATQTGQSEGYIVYCPCMGRFGNQAEQLLGSLLFAKSVNRTLVLPPFINYGLDHKPEIVPFETVIRPEAIMNYHNVVLMDDFMDIESSGSLKGAQRFYCYTTRDLNNEKQNCGALEGEPFKTFWGSFNITETESIQYKPLTTTYSDSEKWIERYPNKDHRVITFVGAPSSFPAHKDAIPIQKFIQFSDIVRDESLRFMRTKDFAEKKYLSLHIRHGLDWEKACELVRDGHGLRQLFSSNQCTGYDFDPDYKLDYDTCYPSFETIVSDLNSTLYLLATEKKITIQVVHIATDNHDSEIWSRLRGIFPNVRFVLNFQKQGDMLATLTDLYLLANSDAFIGNCISSFSAFPARMRSEQLALSEHTYYFGFSFRGKRHTQREEL